MSNINTLFIGRVLEHFETLDSTNVYAQKLLAKSNPFEGTVISTYNQYAGKGQIGSIWESSPGKNISLSIILYPLFLAPTQQFKLSQAISIGVRNFIVKQLTNNTVKIKWPNDIYVNNKKIAGILIQNTISNRSIQSSIAGIGININQASFSSAIPNPTSLTIESGKEFHLDLLIPQLCHEIEQVYLLLKQKKWKQIEEEYLHQLFRINELSNYKDLQGRIFKGSITGISKTGHLILEENGQKRQFAVKEITFL